jgi:hypothetical protein
MAEAGFPDVAAGVLFGATNRIDLGAKIDTFYSANAVIVNDFVPDLGMSLRAWMRVGLYDDPHLSALLCIQPSWHFSRFDPVSSGPEVIVSSNVSIHVAPAWSIYLGVELPLYFQIQPNPAVDVVFSVLPGAGFEYHITDFVGFGSRASAGPVIINGVNGAGVRNTVVDFGFFASAFFIFRWDRVSHRLE